MPYSLDNKLVIAVASSAIFDLGEADNIFQSKGEEAYRRYTREHENTPFAPGPAFVFIQRLLSVNDPNTNFEPIEVILLSKNDADTGNRVLKSLRFHNLPIARAAFTCGQSPYPYIRAFNSALFLSASEEDVKIALEQKMPAGIIMSPQKSDKTAQPPGDILKIAFDFDGIIADDSSEKVYQEKGLEGFQDHELLKSGVPHPPGPLMPLLNKISQIQNKEFEKQKSEPFYKPKIRTAIITSRMSPANDRVIQTLRHWKIHVDESFFLGGVTKSGVLDQYRPHIFFDDQRANLGEASVSMAKVHVPYGITNL